MYQKIVVRLCGCCGGAVDSIVSVFMRLHGSSFNLEFENLFELIWHMVADLWQRKGKIRPRPHVSGYFWKRIFFYPYKKIPASTRGAFSKISPSTRRRCCIQTPLFELWQKKTNNQNALAWSPKIRAHALVRRKSMLWRQRFRKAPFSPVHMTTWKRRFQKDPLWRAFSKRFVLVTENAVSVWTLTQNG